MRLMSKIGLGSMVAIPGLLALGLPAGADTVSVSGAAAASNAEAAAAARTIPTSTLTGKGVFNPTTLSAKGHTGTACSKKVAGAEVLNQTSKSQQLTLAGKAFGSPIVAGGGEYVCYLSATGTPPPTTAKFGVTGRKSTLTISFT